MRSWILLPLLALVPISTIAAPALEELPEHLLAVTANPLGNWDIFLVNPDNGDIKNLTNHKAADSSARWSWDGKQIAFVSDRDGTSNIFTMNFDGTGVKQITKEMTNCITPAWSPDGKKIAFMSAKSGLDNIFVVEVATGRITQLTNEEFASRQPAWSPDGKRISYAHYINGPYEIYAMNADGTNKVNLSQGGGLDAAWSPDGKKIAFTSVRGGGGFRLYTMDGVGGNVKELSTNDNGVGNVFPVWSPDSKKIAFTDAVDGNLQVASVGADGNNYVLLNTKGSSSFPKWAPTGKRVVFARFEQDQPAAMWITDPDGQNQREVLRFYSESAWKPK